MAQNACFLAAAAQAMKAAPAINILQPQSAILGIGKTEKRVVVREVDGVDTIQIRPMAYVSLTIDHRVVDGHQTNGWLSKFVEVLEKLAAGLKAIAGWEPSPYTALYGNMADFLRLGG